MIGVCLQQCIEENHLKSSNRPPLQGYRVDLPETGSFLLVEGDIRASSATSTMFRAREPSGGSAPVLPPELLLEETADRILTEAPFLRPSVFSPGRAFPDASAEYRKHAEKADCPSANHIEGFLGKGSRLSPPLCFILFPGTG
jgi:hypothetical protein